ncbi:MAG: hypothetical protein CMO81_04930 [Waddliaceae bacterium]|nr:hypothetical protein [Waddliaceae bacterium]
MNIGGTTNSDFVTNCLNGAIIASTLTASWLSHSVAAQTIDGDDEENSGYSGSQLLLLAGSVLGVAALAFAGIRKYWNEEEPLLTLPKILSPKNIETTNTTPLTRNSKQIQGIYKLLVYRGNETQAKLNDNPNLPIRLWVDPSREESAFAVGSRQAYRQSTSCTQSAAIFDVECSAEDFKDIMDESWLLGASWRQKA